MSHTEVEAAAATSSLNPAARRLTVREKTRDLTEYLKVVWTHEEGGGTFELREHPEAAVSLLVTLPALTSVVHTKGDRNSRVKQEEKRQSGT